MEKDYYNMPIWQNYEDSVILKKEDVEEYLNWSIKEMRESGDWGDEDIDYFREQNCIILNAMKRVKDDLIGLYLHVMSGWYVLRQDLVKEYRKGELE